MDKDKEASAAIEQIQRAALSLAELLESSKSAEANVREVERLRKVAEKSLASARERCAEAERQRQNTEEKVRRLQAENAKLTDERDELKRKMDRSETGNGPAVKNARMDGPQNDGMVKGSWWRSNDAKERDNRGGDAATRRPPVDLGDCRGGTILCQTYHPAQVAEIPGEPGRRLFSVHYCGWNEMYDEKVTEDDARVRFREYRRKRLPGEYL